MKINSKNRGQKVLKSFLNTSTNPKIPRAILKPFFLKKLTIGPPTVPLIQVMV